MHIGIDASRAFVSHPTGTESYSLNLIRALAEIDRQNDYTLYVKDTNYKIPASPAGGPNTNYPDNFQFKVIPWPYLWTQVGLAIECLKNPPDVLFIPAHTLPFMRRPGLKTVVTIHDLGAEFLPEYHQFPQKLYLNKSTEYAVKQATHLIAVSQSTKGDLITKLHCDPQKISVIWEGYDSKIFNFQFSIFNSRKIKKKYAIDGDYILFVGTVQPRKNLVRLIEAFAKILRYEDVTRSEIASSMKSKKILSEKDKSPNLLISQPALPAGRYPNIPISLVIIGKPGWMYEEIYAAPGKLGVEKQVKFLNYVPPEDLPVFYQNARCFVLPSLCEGFGLPVLEAMACGCPVVVSKTSSLPEIVGGGLPAGRQAGILVDPFDVKDIAKNLQFIIYNLQLRKELIKKGLERVKEFSWEKCARETLETLENV